MQQKHQCRTHNPNSHGTCVYPGPKFFQILRFFIRTKLVIFVRFCGLTWLRMWQVHIFDSAHWLIMVSLKSRFAGGDILGYSPYGARALGSCTGKMYVRTRFCTATGPTTTAWEPDESDYCHHLIVPQMRTLWDEAGESRENSCLLISTPHGHWGL